MKKVTIILFLRILCIHTILAQTPHLQGDVRISILNGTMECDIEMSNIPNIEDYSIRLNSGLNIRYFRDSSDTFNYRNGKFYDDEKSPETFQYFFPSDDNKGKYLPKKFKINYTGKFPVVSDTMRASNRGDWKGNIAFNGKNLRASEQTAWYPILYDIKNDVVLDKVTYDLQINCVDCSSIYMNGAQPQRGTSAKLRSDKSVQLMLFAGQFDFSKNKNTFFINTGLSNKQENVLSTWTDQITKFYESKFNVPYGSSVAYIYTTPISKKNAWMFVTYPTITVIGREQYHIKSYFDEKKNTLRDSANIEYFAHELGHYYFGSVIVPNAELRWVFLEGLTEYVALQTVREVLGENFYQKKLQGYLNDIKDFQPLSLPNVAKNSDIDETYRYIYFPLLITALEKEIGKEKVWNWLRTILNANKTVKTDYNFFKTTLIQSGISELEFNTFEKIYITSDNAKANVVSKVK